MKELIGKTINQVYLDADKQHYLKFETDLGMICYEGIGD